MRIACITFIMIFPFVAALSEIPPPTPKTCSDVNFDNDLVEDYYVLYPDIPNIPTLVYCGVDDGMKPLNSSAPKASAKNCKDLYDAGMHDSGLNAIYPYADHPETPVLVFCDQELLGGGWTVFQKRDEYETQQDFYKTFDEYALGFGNIGQEFWLGLDIIHALTQQSVNELYVDLTSFDDIHKYAHYKAFYVGPREPTAYIMSDRPYYLSLFHYEGNAGDSLTYHLGYGFSTRDADHDDVSDTNCAEYNEGAWWYKGCCTSNLNGVYGEGNGYGPFWSTFSNSYESLRRVTMATRPLQQQ